jgi:ADP-ribose pyrophosphatase YjhB (NUDIX family)
MSNGRQYGGWDIMLEVFGPIHVRYQRKAEKYELASEAARRETEEETGLTLGKVHLVGFTEDISRKQGKHYITIYFVGEWIGGEPVNTEPTKSSDWIPVTDLPKLQDKIWYPCIEKFRHMGWL